MIGLIAKIGKHIGGAVTESPYEDFTEFTSVDPDGDFTITALKIDVDTMQRQAAAYNYKDYGANYFADFDFEFEAESTNIQTYANFNLIGVASTVGTRNDHINNSSAMSCQCYGGGGAGFQIHINEDIVSASDVYQGAGGSVPLYYFKFYRVGTTLVLKVYSDAARTVLIDTLTCTCSANKLRYLHAAYSREYSVTGGLNTVTGYIQNLDINPNDYEEIADMTVEDSGSDFTLSQLRTTFDTMQRQAISYVYKDFGVDYFGDFEVEFEFEITASQTNGFVVLANLSNTIGTYQDQADALDSIQVFVYNNAGSMTVYLRDHSSGNTDTYIPGGTTTSLLYCTLVRQGTACYLYIYSNSDRSTLVDTLSIVVETEAKRYLGILGSRDEPASTATISGYIQNVKTYLYEDFTTYTEVDQTGDITVTASKITWTTMDRDRISYVYKDYEEDYFGDFIIEWAAQITYSSSTGVTEHICVTNTIGVAADMNAADDGMITSTYGNSSNMVYRIWDYFNDNNDTWTVGGTTVPLRYYRLTRAGTTLTLQVYSNSGRTTLVDTLILTCDTSLKRYLYGMCSAGITPPSTPDQSGYVQYCVIKKAA